MKLTTLCSVFVLASVFLIGSKDALEARHYRSNVSFNVGPVISAYPRPVVVQRYSPPVQENYYYPNGQVVSVYRAPQPYYQQVYYPQPAFFSGLSFGFNFR